MKSKILRLAVNGEYFDKMKAGIKLWEYRLFNEFWKKRLLGREYDKVIITRGYPKRDDLEKQLHYKWQGFKIEEIKHKHFGDKTVKVFSINLKHRLDHVREMQ